MKKYSISEYKRTVACAFESNFGVKPKISDIVLHSVTDDRTNIWFSIKGQMYKFSSYLIEGECIWCGDGTVKHFRNGENGYNVYRVVHRDGDKDISTIFYVDQDYEFTCKNDENVISLEKWNKCLFKFDKIINKRVWD